MDLQRDIFMRQAHKYTDGSLQIVNGIVSTDIKEDALRLSKGTNNQPYWEFFENLCPGMSIEDAYLEWLQVLDTEQFETFLRWRLWTPTANEWWVGCGASTMCFRDGKVRLRGTSIGGTPVKAIMRGKNILSAVTAGMTLDELRVTAAQGVYGGKKMEKLFQFKPTVATPQAQQRMTSTKVKKSELPPLLSTHFYDDRVFIGNGNKDQIQIVLYAVSTVWVDNARTKVNPVVKACLKQYYDHAYRMLKECKYVREHPDVLDHITYGHLRVTKDCCIEVDFNISKEVTKK